VIRPNQYSSIRVERKSQKRGSFYFSKFYDALQEPHAILAVFIGYVGFFKPEIFVQHLNGAASRNSADTLYLVLLVLSFFVTMRVLQSVYLASRDYENLETYLWGVISFACVGVFLGIFTSYSIGKLTSLTLLMIYVALALIGALNFLYLWRFKIPKKSDFYDYPMEARIQAINTFVFVMVAACLLYAARCVSRDGDVSGSGWMAVVVACVLIIFNMAHSHQLTMMSKFLFKNDIDAPDKKVEIFKEFFWRESYGVDDYGIKENFFGMDFGVFRPIRSVRADKGDVDKIADHLLDRFGYVFEYIFATQSGSRLRAAVVALLTAANGLGSHGYMHYYILMSEGRAVGFIKLDSFDGSVIYRSLGALILSFRLAMVLGVFSLYGIYRRSKEVACSQPGPEHGEIRITYFLIFPEYRDKNLQYGSYALNLLVGALIRSFTNDIAVEKLTLFVRSGNDKAVRLFERVGFKFREAPHAPDPFEGREFKGALIGHSIMMEYAG
jgi:ribosomal protein S18 acetylase RimI-like enzyme